MRSFDASHFACFVLPSWSRDDGRFRRSAGGRAPTAEDARLAKLFQSYLDQEFRRHPLFATQQGNHDYDDRLDDLSPAARKKDVESRGDARHARQGDRRPEALAEWPDRPRNLDARPEVLRSGRSRTTTASSSTRESMANTSRTACSSCSRSRACRASATSRTPPSGSPTSRRSSRRRRRV